MDNTQKYLEKSAFSIRLFLNILVALPALFLLVNNYPYIMILSILLILLTGILFFLSKPIIITQDKSILSILLIIYIYFIFSYFYSGQLVSKLATYSFLKNDGNFFFCYVLFFVLAVPFFNYKKTVDIFFNFLFISFSFFSLFGIIEFLIHKTSLMITFDTGKGSMFTALNYAHNATGSVYTVVSLLALIFFLYEPKKKKKFLYLAVLTLSVTGLSLTKSMGGYFGFVVALIPILWIYYRSIKKFFITISVFIVITIPIIYLTGIYKRIVQVLHYSANLKDLYSISSRLELWGKAWYLFLKSPIFGVGFGRFNDIEAYNYQRLEGLPGILALYKDSNFIFSQSHAHNSYLQFLAETGIVGLGLLILFWVLCFRIIYKAYNFSTNIYYRRIYLSSLASIIALFALSFTENYMSSTTIMICVSMLTSLSIGLSWQERRTRAGIR
jgi:O-antigen ligase